MRNPILRGMNPDPSACQVDDTTYVVTSSFTWVPGLPIYKSVDLKRWKLCGHALTDPEPFMLDKAHDSGGIYAPTLRYIGGQFVLACTTVVAGEERSFLITARDPAGPWSDPIFLDGVGGIDPDLFEDEDGRIWWTGTRLAEEPLWDSQTEIWTRPIDLETGRFTGEESVIWHGAVEGVVWSEAPHMYRIGDWYYLLTAEGGTAQEHSVSIARAKHPRGPWEGTKRNPIFTHRNLGAASEVQYVGHADLFQRPDGSWWAVLLGVRMRDRKHLLGRETFLVPVDWEDGWPVFAPGLGQVPMVVDVDAATPAERSIRAWAPGASSGAKTPASTPAEISLAQFIQRAGRPHGIGWAHLDEFAGVRIQEWNAGIRTAPEVLLQGAGLGVVQDANNWVRLSRTAAGWQLESCVAGVVSATPVFGAGSPEPAGVSESAGSSPSAGSPWPAGIPESVGVVLDDLELVATASFGQVSAELRMDASWLATEVAGGFTGCHMGVWRPGALVADSWAAAWGID